MKTKLKYSFFATLFLMFLFTEFGCNKTFDDMPGNTTMQSSDNQKEIPISLINNSTNLINGKAKSASTLASYGCGSNLSGSTTTTGFYTYPSSILDLTTTINGSTITITVNSYDTPNRFTVYDANNNFVTATNWMGHVSYSGPWGTSLNTAETGTLQFIKGVSNTYSIKVETVVQTISDNWTASVTCKYVPNVSDVQITNVAVKNVMINSFNSLNVNFVALGSDLGLGHTLTANDLDFTQIYQTYDVNNSDTGKAVTVRFKTNSNSNLNNYGFTLYTDGITYIKPTIIHSRTNQFLKYYDLTENLLTTINNYALSSYTFSTVTSNIAPSGVSPLARGGCGQAVANCMGDLYTNRGWLSVWAFVQTAFIPETAVVVAATCAWHNCR